jgi:hypothetical protein
MSIDVRRQQLRVSVGKTFIGTSLPILVAHLISQQQLAYLVCAHLVLGVIMMRLTLGSNDDADRSMLVNLVEIIFYFCSNDVFLVRQAKSEISLKCHHLNNELEPTWWSFH